MDQDPQAGQASQEDQARQPGQTDHARQPGQAGRTDAEPLTLVWLHDDLRLADNPALTWAAARGAVIVVHVDEPESATGVREPGEAAVWWLDQSLGKLERRLAAHRVALIRARGDAATLLPRLARVTGAGAATWQHRHHTPLAEHDAAVADALRTAGLTVTEHPGHLLTEPADVTTRQGGAYRVFTPFSRRAGELIDTPGALGAPLPEPALHGPGTDITDAARRDVGNRGDVARPRDVFLERHNAPGEQAARARLDEFLRKLVEGPGYEEGHDFPAVDATSGLSAHLRFGEVSPREVWVTAAELADREPKAAGDAHAFLRQLLWRDFAWHRLHHHPDIAWANMRSRFDDFGWEYFPADGPAEHREDLARWQTGRTGIPLVDAGMRELAETGRMHNRVRMVVGSLLTKNLGIHWRHGEEWFWERHVDADHAANPFNWQWVAGCGDDAAPYFRIFNPVTQAERFDPDGEYVARWVPELGIDAYPEPMLDLKASRRRALAAYERIKDR